MPSCHGPIAILANRAGWTSANAQLVLATGQLQPDNRERKCSSPPDTEAAGKRSIMRHATQGDDTR